MLKPIETLHLRDASTGVEIAAEIGKRPSFMQRRLQISYSYERLHRNSPAYLVAMGHNEAAMEAELEGR